MQHGIRVQQIGSDVVASAPKVSFAFNTKRGKTYSFEFVMISGKPWVPIVDVEKTLYHEHVATADKSATALSRNGRSLEAHAAALLDPAYRMVSGDGSIWLRASGVLQILMRRDEPVCAEFREQLCDWLENSVSQGRQAMVSASVNASMQEANALQEMGINALAAIVEQMRDHLGGIRKAQGTADEAKQIATETAKRLDNLLEVGYATTDEFLRKKYPQLATQQWSSYLGREMARRLSRKGGKRTEEGWFTSDGRQVSKCVPSPGTQYSSLNKWSEVALETLMKRLLVAPPDGLSAASGAPTDVLSGEWWARKVDQSGVSGLARELARHLKPIALDGGRITFDLAPDMEHLRSRPILDALYAAMLPVFGDGLRIEVQVRRATQA